MDYFLGIGSNIDPYHHIPKILEQLFYLSKTITISRIVETKPEKLISPTQFFLNLVVAIECDLSAEQLKQKLNQIEVDLGRNRNDPDKKVKDRVADIDILFVGQATVNDLPPEPYLRPMAIELLATVPHYYNPVPMPILPQGQAVQLYGHQIGQFPTKLVQTAPETIHIYQLETHI